jgi:hypothetical protein
MPDPRITNAKSLEELQTVLHALAAEFEWGKWVEESPYEIDELPTFGGTPFLRSSDPFSPAWGLFSWDSTRVLWGDTPGEVSIISRSEYLTKQTSA